MYQAYPYAFKEQALAKVNSRGDRTIESRNTGSPISHPSVN